ncbi:MAG TPA: ATP-binding protein [Thermoanaerobaculia bacterium]|nr:ATP-binding protein [Thermoanaerobaculia bacterium]
MNARGTRPADIPTLLLYGGAGLLGFFAVYELLETYVLSTRLGEDQLHLLHIVRGITASLLLATFVASYLIRHPTLVHRFDEARGTFVSHEEWNREHLRWFIRMRWVAAGVTIGLIAIAVPITGVLSADYLPQLFLCWGALIVANLVFMRVLRRGADFERQVIAQTVVDLVILTGFLNASGGLENPLAIAYLFHVIIAGILLPRRKALAVAIFGAVIFTALVLGEFFDILPHATILLFPHGHSMVGGHLHIEHAAHDVMFVTGRLLSFIAVMFLTSYFTTLVTERLRQSESDLEASALRAMMERRRLEGVIDSAGLGILIIGAAGAIDWMNERVMSWLAWSEMLIGQPCPHEHREGSGCIACVAEEARRSGEKNESEIVLSGGTRGTHFLRAAASPVRDAEGNVVQSVVVVEDVTSRKALEAEALHAGRLSVLGQLAAGIAHEIGNPLSSLHARLQLMKRRAEPEFHRESLDVLQTQIDRIGRIVRNVSHLAQRRAEGWMQIDLNAVVSEAVSLVRLDRRAAGIEFHERLQESLPPVHGVRDQLLQVCINLLLNAVEAMPEGGTLEAVTVAEGRRVKIGVTDSGAGIDESVRRRLFEPFFTTKPNGTGLGLSICYSLVHAHGGTIDVTSEAGKGSRFVIDLPVIRKARNER